MVAIGPKGAAYSAAAFEIFADIYYRTEAAVAAALVHPAIAGLTLAADTPEAGERAELVFEALAQGLAPVQAMCRGETPGVAPRSSDADSGPAGFALAAVWSRLLAHRTDPGLKSAGYFAADFTARLLRRLLVEWRAAPPPFAADAARLCAEAEAAAIPLRHALMDALTEAPEIAPELFRGFDRLNLVFPLPLLDEAMARPGRIRAVA